jgi:hypothetical protein
VRYILAALFILISGIAPAGAQNGSPEDIIIQGRREGELRHLLEAMTPSRMGRQIARWDRKVCIRVEGLEAQHAAFVKARISALADELGVGAVKSPDCTPDITIIFALDADAVTASLVKRYPELIGEIDLGAVNKRTKAVYLAPHAVRWLGQDWLKPDQLAVASRLRVGNRQAITAIVSVVDLTKLQGISWGQLSDFLAFVAMSRPNFDQVYSDPGTILSLFTLRDAGRPLPTGLTALDTSLLSNLYKTVAEQTPERQQQDIRRHVKADLAKGQ